MSKLSPTAPSAQRPERRYRRFPLHYPVRMKVQFADFAIELEGMSRNVSIGGLLMETSSMVPQHTPVSFVMTVHGLPTHRLMQFTGEGKVVRVDTRKEEVAFAIAVECQRPIAQLEDYLAATGS